MNPDPTVIFVAKLLALMIGVEMANVVAPQLVIAAGALAGAYFGLADWRQSSRLEAFGYVLSFAAVGWLLAGTLAAVMAAAFHIENTQLLMSPCAIGIGWVGHRWPKVGEWAGGVIRAVIERRSQQ